MCESPSIDRYLEEGWSGSIGGGSVSSRRAAHLSVQGQNLSPTSSSSLDMDLFSPPEHKLMFRPSALLAVQSANYCSVK